MLDRIKLGLWGIIIGLGFGSLMKITNAEQIGEAASIYIIAVFYTALIWGL